MIRWLVVVVLALLLASGLTAWLRRFGFGRLPGDFEFRAFGREWQLADRQHGGAQHPRRAGGQADLTHEESPTP